MGIAMKWLALLLIAVFFSQSLVLAADTVDDLAQQAEAAYATRNFKLAAGLYQQLIDQGVKRSEVEHSILRRFTFHLSHFTP